MEGVPYMLVSGLGKGYVPPQRKIDGMSMELTCDNYFNFSACTVHTLRGLYLLWSSICYAILTK